MGCEINTRMLFESEKVYVLGLEEMYKAINYNGYDI